MRTLIIVSALGLLAAATTTSAQPRPMTTLDLISIDRVSDPQVSPDGSRVTFVLSELDLEADGRSTDLWITNVAGGTPRRLTTDPAGDFAPRWSPDGDTLYFLSTRSGSSQVWRLNPNGGAPEAVTDLPLSVADLTVSPDGRSLAVSIEVFTDCDSLACTADRLRGRDEGPRTGQLFDSVFVRHWDTWEDGRRSHVFVLPITGGPAVDVMRDLDADSPSVPFGGASDFAFTPDSRSIVLSSKVLSGSEKEPWSTNYDLWLAPADGSTPPRNLTDANDARDAGPLFSPDGTTLAYRAMERPGFESDRYRIMLRAWPEGEPRELAPDWDRSPGSLLWSADSATLYATAANLGHVSLFAIDIATGEVETIVDDLGYVSAPALAADRLLFGLDHLRLPVELYTVLPDGSGLRQVTQVNTTRIAGLALGAHEQFTFQGADGDTVYGMMVRPTGFDATRNYPVAFLIHGGPQGSFGNHFHYRWNPQSYAAAGYAVVMIDFHGSVGYGQAFTDSISGDWGGKPLEDLRLGLDAALKRYKWMDDDNVCALGASYGGYMVNWIAGNWPDRFQCLVNHDGVFDMRSMYYSTEELWFPEWEHGGPYHEASDEHEKHNPVRFVDQWQTPMLVIHGQEDHRVPLEQGLATFTALQRRGVPSRFLYFPDENHWVLKPNNSIQWHETVLGWLDQWLPDSPPTEQ
jgi:dipeptidyl aminopeptidase/acylaminoacyl peptidase